MNLVLNVTSVVAPALMCVLVGFALAKFRLPFDHKVATSLAANVGVPCLVISHLSEQHVEVGEFVNMMLGAVTAIACFAAIAAIFLTANRLPLRGFLTPMMFSNVGALGLPVSLLAFGDAGLAHAMAFWIVNVVGIFTVGTWIPQGRITLKALLSSPAIYSVAIGLALMETNTPLPKPIHQTLDILGGLTIPLMLLTLGHTLAGLKPSLLLQGAYLGAFHLLMAAAVAFVLVQLFEFQGVSRGAFILQCLMPVAVFSYLWVEEYDSAHAPQVASFILVSTLMSIVVLPLALTYWI